MVANGPSEAPNCRGCQPKYEKPFSPPPASVPVSSRPPKPSPKRCCLSSTSPSFSTASRRRCIRDPEHHHRHRPRQDRHRRSLRCQLRARTSAGSRGKEGPAGHRPRHLRHDQRLLRAPEGGAGPGPRRAARAELVGDEPFAVVLADDVIDAETPCLRQLLDIYNFFSAPGAGGDGGAARTAFRPTALSMPSPCAQRRTDRVYRIRDLVEKPKASEAPSNLAIIGRYVLTPEIFESLQAIDPGAGAKFSSPTLCATCCAAGPSTLIVSKARATMRAISSASSRRPWNTRSAATIWAARSANI